VLVTNVNTANSLWAHLFIRFDIQAEQGSVELNPHVTIRTFQWPLQPLL
jgi:hypothetical protein